VAGYQVHKLFVGAGGRSGVLLRANFRLRPRPERREIAFAAGSATDVEAAASALAGSGLEPVVWMIRGAAMTRLRAEALDVLEGEAAAAWLFEGDDARVRWLAGEARRVVRATGVEIGETGEDADAVRAVDEMVALAEPEDAPPDEAALRISVPPVRAIEVANEVYEVLSGDDVAAAVTADPFVGVVQVRWCAAGAAKIDEALPALAELTGETGGVARLLYLPPEVRPHWSQLLTADPDAELAERILGVFDPAGTFAPARVGGSS
jgi:FAD/FMN-containing dehydrogenase